MCHHLQNKTTDGRVHPTPTENGLCYYFRHKHHDKKNDAEGQWTLSNEAEFEVFDTAASKKAMLNHDYYGVRVVNGRCVPLGMRQEKVAKFPAAGPDEAWHGFPLWPLKSPKKVYSRRPNHQPTAALRKMQEVGVINWKQLHKLEVGK